MPFPFHAAAAMPLFILLRCQQLSSPAQQSGNCTGCMLAGAWYCQQVLLFVGPLLLLMFASLAKMTCCSALDLPSMLYSESAVLAGSLATSCILTR